MLSHAKAAGDTKRIGDINDTQEGYGCRNEAKRQSLAVVCRRSYKHTVIEGGPDAFTTIDTVLLAAGTEDEAYKKAMEYGQSCAREYLNTDGKRINIDFRGLRNLFFPTDGLVDRGLLFYEELTGLTDSDIAKIVKTKLEMAAFQPIGRPLDNAQI